MTQHFDTNTPAVTYLPHSFAERQIDLGEVTLNYAVAGQSSAPALLLIPGQAASWWDYESVMARLQSDFQVFAVDLRGQGRSSRTPRRYTLDTWGNDLVRLIQHAIGRPTLVAGHSSGGVLAAWLAAYAPRNSVKAVYLEDAPLFSSELVPACGPGVRQTAVGLMFELFCNHLGDQWAIGDWKGMLARAPSVLPSWMHAWIPTSDEPPQNLKEYDPEWARAFYSGTASANCSNELMLRKVRTPVLFSHHFRTIDSETGILQGAISDVQVNYARNLVEGAGQPFNYRSLPERGHALHEDDEELYVSILMEWFKGLPVTNS
ncbi:MAG: alpha/beta hydrolase [Paraburkholderia sp.]|jgi:pimeloyl-ACP methyl ester carboxylesterase|uniref:alpha/beta hydrolase n=2 Tax=Burkholderiaceae TaxID=119060 RepID=UPI00397D117B